MYLFVAMAKRRLLSVISMDGIYTPTEAFVIDDNYFDPKLIIRDLLTRAKYSFLAIRISLTVSEPLGKAAQI